MLDRQEILAIILADDIFLAPWCGIGNNFVPCRNNKLPLQGSCGRGGVFKNCERIASMADNAKKNEGKVNEKPAADGEAQVKITLDDKNVEASYSNFCRVTGTSEEILIDFALNPNPFARVDQNITIDNRLVLNHFTAKRLLAALQQTIMRHEQNFGVIELNVQRRLAPGAQQAAAEGKKK